MPRLSIIIPVYNEKNTILEILSRVDKIDLGTTEKEIIIVDDYSTDGTRELLKSLGMKYKIYYQEKNQGKGSTLRTGFAYTTGDWVVVQDADLEYDPNDFKNMLSKMKEHGVQVVFGSRRLHSNYLSNRHSGHIFALGGVFLTWLTNLLYNTGISDEPTCYKMFQTSLLKSLNLTCIRFEFCPEVTSKIAKRGIKIYEVPISYNPRHKNEGKKINWRDGFEAIWVLIKNRF
ncbi:MAG: glycosyltransferase family 2 protein [Candidatus Staskawiczbacteria bacterium]|nr:glycosyltransferase family 2 protein [Candidatus Staskawiczbacteria bacterium]